MRRNSGLTGLLKNISKTDASGKHDTFDNYNARYNDIWPVQQWVSVTPRVSNTYNRGQILYFDYSGNLDYNQKIYFKINTVSGTWDSTDLDSSGGATMLAFPIQWTNVPALQYFNLKFKPTNTSKGAFVFNISAHIGSYDNAAAFTTNNITITDQSLSVSVPASTDQTSSLTMTFTTVGATNGDTIYWYLDSNWNPSSGTATVSNNSATATSTPVPAYYSSTGSFNTTGSAYLISTTTSGTAKSFTPVTNKKYITPELWLQINGGSTYSYNASDLSVNEGDAIRVYLTGTSGGTLGPIYNNQVALITSGSTSGFSTSDVTQGTLTGTLNSSNSYSTTFNITNDVLAEGVEYVQWQVTSAYDGTTLATSRRLAVQDTSVPPTISSWQPLFEAQSYVYQDPSSGTYTYSTTESSSFNIRANVTQNLTYSWAIQHGTTVDADFSVLSGTATASGGALIIPISPVADATTEYDQTFKILVTYNNGPVTNGTSPYIRLKDTSVGTQAVFMNIANASGAKSTTSGNWSTSISSNEGRYMYYHPTFASGQPAAINGTQYAYYQDSYYVSGSNLAWTQNAYYSSNSYGYMDNFSRDGLASIRWNGNTVYSLKYASAYPTSSIFESGTSYSANISPMFSASAYAKPHFNADGTKMYLTYYAGSGSPVGWYTDTYSLTTAYQVNSYTFLNTWKRAAPTTIMWPEGSTTQTSGNNATIYERGHFEFNASGTKVVTMHPTDRWSFKVYTLSTAWDLSTATESGNMSMLRTLAALSINPTTGLWQNQSNVTDPNYTLYSGIKCFTISPDGLQLWIQLIDSSGYQSGARYTFKFDIPAEYIVPKLYIGQGYLANVDSASNTSTTTWWPASASGDMTWGNARPALTTTTGDSSFAFTSGSYSFVPSNNYGSTGLTVSPTNSVGTGTATSSFTQDGLHMVTWQSAGNFSTNTISTYSCPTAFSSTGATLISSATWTPSNQSWNGPSGQINYPTIGYAKINNAGNALLFTIYDGNNTNSNIYIFMMGMYSSAFTFMQSNFVGNSSQGGIMKSFGSSYNPSTASGSYHYFTVSPNGKKIMWWDNTDGTCTTLREYTLPGIYFLNYNTNINTLGTTKSMGTRTYSAPYYPIWNYDGSKLFINESWSSGASRKWMRQYNVTLTELAYPAALSDSVFMVPTSTSSTGTSMTIGFNPSYTAGSKIAESLSALVTAYPSSYYCYPRVVTGAMTDMYGIPVGTVTANNAYNVTINATNVTSYTEEYTMPTSVIMHIERPSGSYAASQSPLQYADGTDGIYLSGGLMYLKCSAAADAARLTAFLKSLIKVGDTNSTCTFYTGASTTKGKYVFTNITDISRNASNVVITGSSAFTADSTLTADYIEFAMQYGVAYSYVAPPVPTSPITVTNVGSMNYGPYGQYFPITFDSSASASKVTAMSKIFSDNNANEVSSYMQFIYGGLFYENARPLWIYGNTSSPYMVNSTTVGMTGFGNYSVDTSTPAHTRTTTNTVYFKMTMDPYNSYSRPLASYSTISPSQCQLTWNSTITSTVFLGALVNTTNCPDFLVWDGTYLTTVTNITAISTSGLTTTISGTITSIDDTYGYYYGYNPFVDFAYKYIAPTVYTLATFAFSDSGGNVAASTWVNVYPANAGDAAKIYTALSSGGIVQLNVPGPTGTVWSIPVMAPNSMYYMPSGGPYGNGMLRLDFAGSPSPVSPTTGSPPTLTV